MFVVLKRFAELSARNTLKLSPKMFQRQIQNICEIRPSPCLEKSQLKKPKKLPVKKNSNNNSQTNEVTYAFTQSVN